MRGLDWSNQSYVRLYKADTATWRRLGFEARSVYMHLLRLLDRSGTMPIEDLLPHEAIAEMVGCDDDQAERALERLRKAGYIEISADGSLVVDPEYMDREDSTKSDRQRQRESRERRHAEAMLRPVTASHDSSQAVTIRDVSSQSVTECHTRSQDVTDGHSVPCRAVPCRTVQKEEGPPAPPTPAAQAPVPKEWKPLHLKPGEDLALRALLESPEKIDPEGRRAKKTEKKALRTEWLHHLARLLSLPLPKPGAEPWLDLWACWRVKAREKSRTKVERDWDPQVGAFRQLWELHSRQHPGDEGAANRVRHFALLLAEERGWQGLQADHVWNEIESRRKIRGLRPGRLPPEGLSHDVSAWPEDPPPAIGCKAWRDAVEELRKADPEQVGTWLDPIVPCRAENDVVHLWCPNDHFRHVITTTEFFRPLTESENPKFNLYAARNQK